MCDCQLDISEIQGYIGYLRGEERSRITIEKYLRDLKQFYCFLGEDKRISKERVIDYKAYLGAHYKLSSANSMLAAINGLLKWLGMESCRVKSYKNQRKLFCDSRRELDKKEYGRLIDAARKSGNVRLELIMQTMCGTGIRIGELPFITVEAVRQGEAVVSGKGKQRIIFILPKLRKYLLKYIRIKKIECGSIFITSKGNPVDRSNVWREMKHLCDAAGVDKHKVFPHNLRHLFARICYRKKKDIVYLADILGHSNIETTRIYTISSGNEHKRMLSSLGLVV